MVDNSYFLTLEILFLLREKYIMYLPDQVTLDVVLSHEPLQQPPVTSPGHLIELEEQKQFYTIRS